MEHPDKRLEVGPSEVAAARGVEIVEQYFVSIREFEGLPPYPNCGRLFVVSTSDDAVYTFRHASVSPSTDSPYMFFYAADGNGIGAADRVSLPLYRVKGIGRLKEPVRNAIQPSDLQAYVDQCAVAEFSHRSEKDVPPFPLHGIIQINAIDDNRFIPTDHDYHGVRSSDEYYAAAYAINSVTLCPCTHPC